MSRQKYWAFPSRFTATLLLYQKPTSHHSPCHQSDHAPTPLTRYIFPMSLNALRIQTPNPVVELLLVGSTSPHWLWEEVEEAFKDSAYNVSITKSKTTPTQSILASSNANSVTKHSILRAEVDGQNVLMEYCPHEKMESLVSSMGRFPSRPISGHHLGRRAHYIQQSAYGLNIDARREIVGRYLQWAHNSGLLSKRLDLLMPEQIFDQTLRDPKYSSSSSSNIFYEVGYEDRFEDTLVWVPIEKWVQSIEEEEEEEKFVPLYGIRK